MNAEEARRISEHAVIVSIEEPLRQVIKKVVKAANNNSFKVINPFAGIHINSRQKEALINHLTQNLKYKYREFANPDKGNPCSSDYTELTW